MTRRTLQTVLGVLAVYLIVRGIGEFFVIDVHDPSTYRKDWGGPSLIGVLAVHSGPALLLIAAAFTWIRRRHHENSSWKGISS